MSHLLIKDDDPIFKCGLFQPSHLFYYNGNKGKFLQMIEKQPNWYWLQFLITFRSAMYERGLVPWKDERRVHCEEAYIAMLDLLVDKDIKSRSRKVKQLVDDIHEFYKTSALRTNLGPSASRLFTTPEMIATMGRLYGSAADYPKKYRKFAQWSILVSTLVAMNRRWNKLRTTQGDEDRLQWSPPAHWREPSKLQRVHLFEEQLKVRWGAGLEALVGVAPVRIVWWPIIEVMNLKRACELLPKVSVVEYDLDTMTLFPWEKPESNKHSLGHPEDVSEQAAALQEYKCMLVVAQELKLTDKEFCDQFKNTFRCFEGLKRREWKGHSITLELARESFLSRLQRERSEQRPPVPVAAAAERSGASSSDEEGEEACRKGALPMFRGTKRVLEQPGAGSEGATAGRDVLQRFESFSEVWRDNPFPGKAEVSRKRTRENHVGAETSLKPQKDSAQKPVSNDKTRKAYANDKITLAEQRRLKSLAEKKRIFNEQKKLIQTALASVDGKQSMNKRIVFNSDDSDGDAPEPVGERPAAARTALFDEDSADEADFTVNHHFEGEKGQKLLELQSRYGNDERFKLDQRFRDDENDTQQREEESSEHEEDERVQNLKILGSLLGREIPLVDKKKKSVDKPMLRFDPTKPDHVKYEIKKPPSGTSNPAVGGNEENKNSKKKKGAAELKSQPGVNVSKEKFYKVSESLKETFQKTSESGAFSLRKMFGSDEDEASNGSDAHDTPNVDSRSSRKVWSQNQFKYDSSDQEEDGGGGKDAGKAPSGAQKFFKDEAQFTQQGNTFFFLPADERLREGVDFFNQKRSNTKRNEHFSEHRKNLKKWVKIKVQNNKNTMFLKNKTFRRNTHSSKK